MLLGQLPEEGEAAGRRRSPRTGARSRWTTSTRARCSPGPAYKEAGRLAEAPRGLRARAHARPAQRQGALAARGPAACARAGPRDAEAVIEGRARAQGGRAPVPAEARARAQIEARRFAEAEQSLRAALEKKPGLESCALQPGPGARGAGRRDEAIAAYRDEVQDHEQGVSRGVQPGAPAAGARDARTRRWPTSGRRSPPSPTFGTGQLYLAKALLDRGDLAGAERWAKAGLANEPEPRLAPLGHFVLADVYNRMGRTADARREQRLGQKRAAGG